MGAYTWTPTIALHAGAAIASILIGAVVLYRTKGTPAHRLWGRVWVALMLTIVVSSLFIYRDHYSWIHGLSFFTLAMLPRGVYLARKHHIKQHQMTMVSMYFGALVIAGIFTLLPSRLMGQAVWRWFGI
ncbi:MAG: DUF2306 domain-containing protein [Rhodobacteraceae bacterium]|nr:DUF2306 domain-containing protein [Paracoccaceae bacterium]